MYWLLLGILIIVILLIPTAYAGLIGAPFVPTRRAVLRKAFEELRIGEQDTVVDLGAGSGTVIKEAVQRGAKAIGYELSPIMWAMAWLSTRRYPNAQVKLANFYRQQLPTSTTIVFAFLMPKIMPRLYQWLQQQELPHARYLMAYMFRLPELPPEHIIQIKNIGSLYVYDMAKVKAQVHE